MSILKYRKFCKLALCLSLSILLVSLSGCTEDTNRQGILDNNTIAIYESLYGCERDSCWDTLGFTQRDIDKEEPFYCVMGPKREIAGEEFLVLIGWDLLEGEPCFSGLTYTLQTDNEGKAIELIRTLFQESERLYGVPSTYEGVVDRISTQLESAQGGLLKGSFERWNIGESTEYTLRVARVEGSEHISLAYRFGAHSD